MVYRVFFPTPKAMGARFSGRYSPTEPEKAQINEGLRGFQSMPDLIGVSHYIPPQMEQALWQQLKQNQPFSEPLVQALATQKTRLMNFFAVFHNKPIRKPADFQAEAQGFLKDLQEKVADMTGVFKKSFGFTEKEITLVQYFIARTAPTLFIMGYPDAVDHCATVSKLAGRLALDKKASRQELLQAVMVGWLHDPKYPTDISFENLAVHPVVASAMATRLFQDSDFKQIAKEVFHNTRTYKRFTTGIVDALAINNDSRWVNENVILPNILKQVEATIGTGLHARISDSILERVTTAGRGRNPQPVLAEVLAALNNITIPSGIIGLRKPVLHQVAGEVGEAMLNGILEGQNTAPETVQQLNRALVGHNGFYQVKVHAGTLLHHHHDVSATGKAAAMALVQADPLLLSAHKILASYRSNKATPALIHIHNFMASFDDNIRDLPQKSRKTKLPWQRAVYISLLHAATELTGKKQEAREFIALLSKQSMQKQIQSLKEKLDQESVWGEYGRAKPDSLQYEAVIAKLEQSYMTLVTTYRQAVERQDHSDTQLDTFTRNF